MFDVSGQEARRASLIQAAVSNPYDSRALQAAFSQIAQMDQQTTSVFAQYQQFQQQQAALQQQFLALQSILRPPRQGAANNPLSALLGGLGGAAGGAGGGDLVGMLTGLLGQLGGAAGAPAAGAQPAQQA
jgi:hypothetical protein